MGTVSEMPAWRGQLIVLLLALHAGARDDIHSEETFRIEERWKEYRNIVKDGFFLNDSMIVLAEYEDVNDKSNEINQVAQETPSVSTLNNKMEQSIEESKGLNFKTGFESTMKLMMNALGEIQERGDQMIEVINEQQYVLRNIKMEVQTAEKRLLKVSKATEDMELIRKETERRRRMEENEQRIIRTKKRLMESELKELERHKTLAEQNLRKMELKTRDLGTEVREVAENILSHKSGLASILSNITFKESELKKLKTTVREEEERLKSVQEKLRLSTHQSDVQNSEESISSLPSLSDKTDSSNSTSIVLFGLMASLILNILTFSYIISTFLPSSRIETNTIEDSVLAESNISVPVFGERIDRTEVMIGSEKSANEMFEEEKRFDNKYTQDMYYNLPRKLNY